MVLDLLQIQEIIINNPNKDRIKKAVDYYNLLNMHVNGVNADYYLEKISEYENKEQLHVRNRLKETNKGLFANLLHTSQKVFSAKGGSRRYNLPDSKQQEFKNKLSKSVNNLSIKKWLEKKIYNKYIVDPNGILLMEVSNNETKPTFKHITEIYDYQTIGQKVEYVIFHPFKLENEDDNYYYRVIDDNFDYIIKEVSYEKEKTYTIVTENTFINHFGYCPAYIVSDIFHNNEMMQKSFIDETLEKANKFFFDNSVHTVHKLLHGFTKYSEYGRDCLRCDGTGLENFNGQEIKCNICSGSGTRPQGRVSDKTIIPYPEKDDPVITKFSFFESPDISIWKQYKIDLKDHEKDLFRMLWNTNYSTEIKNETATGRFLDIQPLNEKLNTISDNFENLEKFIVDSQGLFYYNNLYNGSSINNGRRYLVESTDELFNKLNKSIDKKLSILITSDIYKEYIESKYANNDIEITIKIKLIEIEPFAFFTIQEVKSFGLDEEYIKRKIYFNDWYSEKSDLELFLKDKKTLKLELDEFVKDKIIKIQETTTKI